MPTQAEEMELHFVAVNHASLEFSHTWDARPCMGVFC